MKVNFFQQVSIIALTILAAIFFCFLNLLLRWENKTLHDLTQDDYPGDGDVYSPAGTFATLCMLILPMLGAIGIIWLYVFIF